METKILKVYNAVDGFISKNLSRFYENSKLDKALFMFLLFLIGIGMYILNYYTTLIADDYSYSFSLGHRTTGIMAILQAQYNQYFSWTGRAVVHIIARFFLMYDKVVFNIANTLAYLALVLTVYFHAVGKFKFYPFLLLLINLFFFLFTPAFGQVFLWVVGACNYLWGPLLVFLYLVPYRLQYSKATPVIANKVLGILFGLLGVIAGWTNENLCLTLVFIIFVFMYLYWREHKKVYFWCVCGLIGASIGAVALLLAPGNFVRAEYCELHIFKNFLTITKFLFQKNYLLIPICIMLSLLISCKKDTDYKLLSVYVLGMLVSMYAMTGSPTIPDRTKLGALAFAVIACGNLYTHLEFSLLKSRKSMAILVIIMMAVTCSEYRTARGDIKAYKLRNDAKVEHVLNEKAKGNFDIVVERNYPRTRYAAPYGLGDITEDVNHWRNTGFARYYGVKTVRVE